MPTKAFEVIVAQPAQMSRDVAIASAAKYLAYSDQTDTYGYHGDTIDVDVYGGDGDDWGIALTFNTTIENDAALKRFMDEMAMLSRVETVEEVSVVMP